MSETIIAFFTERKTAWLKAKLKPSLSDSEQIELLQEAEEKFSLATWLPDAAKRASQLSMVSHPGKFSHPSARTSPFIAKCSQTNDGYLRSGNVRYDLDVFGNAAALDVYKFLSLHMEDNRTVLAHLEEDTDAIRIKLAIPTANYEDLKKGFMSIKQIDQSNKTDALVKQVYFPVDNAYHLLSVLTPSGLLTQVKSRIDTARFSDETKAARESHKKNEHHSTGYHDLLNLTITAYGGTQPQNISVLNSQNAGRAYLLPCIPTSLQKREIQPPLHDFFKNTLRVKYFQESFQNLHKLMQCELNNFHIRKKIENILKFIIDRVIGHAFKIRDMGIGWSDTKNYLSLPLTQRIWLDDIYKPERDENDDWVDEITQRFSRWILFAYEYSLKKDHIKMGGGELAHIHDFVDEAVKNDREYFK